MESAKAVLSFLVLFSGTFSPLVSTVNQSTYPWLVPGAYARYESITLGSPPGFVLSNGTLLSSFGVGCPCFADASLAWQVINRTDSVVFLGVTYTISGREHVTGSRTSIPFDYAKTLGIKVDTVTGMAYINETSVGIVGFWSVPLPSVGESIAYGTAFIDGGANNVSHSLSLVDECDQCGLGGVPLVNGVEYSGTLQQYHLPNSVFVAPLQGLNLGTNYTTIVPPGAPQHLPLPPDNAYDYYNGLAIVMSIPEYPHSRSICDLNGNSTANCHVALYSTTLGEYLRSYSGAVYLKSTNIDLAPSSSGGFQPQWTIVAVVGSIAVVSSFLTYRWSQKRRRVHSRQQEAVLAQTQDD